jgi:hypothetical protein
MNRGPALSLSVALALVAIACAGTAQPPSPSPTGLIRGAEPSSVQPSVGSPQVPPSPGGRADGVWVGTITGHHEIEVEGGEAHYVEDTTVDAYLTEASMPLVVDRENGGEGRTVGEYVTLDQLGTVVTASMSHVDSVDGSTCTGDGMVTLPSGWAGWIGHKWDEADVTAIVGFDVPTGGPWYAITLEVSEEVPWRCSDPAESGTIRVFPPPIGRWPMVSESESWDIEMRTLSSEGLAMTGTFQRHWVVGTDVHDLTAEWNLTWAAEAP